jgi:NADP-reducing hydrogenase subunit HndC
MEPFRYHVYICTQEKANPAAPSCSKSGSGAVLEALRAELAKAGLSDDVQVTTSGSVGLCTRGPNLIVYPEGVWYSGVQVADVPELVSEHFINGRPVARLANTDAAALKAEILENKRKALAAMKNIQLQ